MKRTVILCVIFSIIFLALGLFIGILFQKNKSIETSYSKEKAEKILKEYKENESNNDALFDKAQDAADNWKKAEDLERQLETMAIKTFNEKFRPYEGDFQSASQIRVLISTVKASNALDENHQITVEPSDIASKLKSSKKYLVEFDYAKDGYINKIHIEEIT